MKSDDDDNLSLSDELDLFASEESESENEGRFKSSSKQSQGKTEKPTTVSFTKLGQSSTSNVKEALNTSSGRSLSPRDRDRRRDGKRSDSRNERRWNSQAAKKDDGKKMFKATFKAVEGDGKRAIGE